MPVDKKAAFATREQELLLQAALMKGDDAMNAWHEWKNAVDLEGHPDNGSYRLFPLLYKNLEQHGIKHPFMNRLRGMYRQAWYKNQRLFYDMSKVMQLLHDAGIRTMVLKGAALAVLFYDSYAVRPMADVDVLVHPSQALSAIDLLKRSGWKALRDINEDDLYYLHSVQFNDRSGKEFDLHWHPIWDACRKNNDLDLWRRAVPVTIATVPTLAPSPADNLLHAIMHGTKYNQEPPIRWIADAATLINSSNTEINWNYFIQQVKRHRVVFRVRKAIRYVQDKFNVPVPKTVIDDLNHLSTSYSELIEYEEKLASPENRNNSLLFDIVINFSEYRRITGHARSFSAFSGFPQYLRWRYKQKSYCQLCSYIIMKSCNKVRKNIFSRQIHHSSN